MSFTLFTIGHSNQSVEAFVSLLHQHGVSAVADVRSHPYSRFLPHFNREALKAALNKASIYYVFLGDQLGARPDDESCYIENRALYEKIAATAAFKAGIQRLIKGAQQQQIALMCAEKDPLMCHRAVLVCQYLKDAELEIAHILKDGSIESHHHLETRMLVEQGLSDPLALEGKSQLSLFEESTLTGQPRELSVKRAYELQGEAIAYTETGDASDGPVS